MSKVILISGSNRKGNTEYILSKLNNLIESSKLILLKNKNIEFCKGCLACHKSNQCIIKDDVNSIIDKLIQAELIVFGVPNYFDNVSGLFKNFMDRLHPLYKNKQIKNKKVIYIFVGGGKTEGTKESLHLAISGLQKYLLYDVIKEFSFKALNPNDIKEQDFKIKEVANKISSYL